MKKKVLILGDVAIDHLYHPLKQADKGDNWQLYPSLQTSLLPGGAFVLSNFIIKALKVSKTEAIVSGYVAPENLYGRVAQKLIQAKVLLSRFKVEKQEWIRVEKYQGYSAPTGNLPDLSAAVKNQIDIDLLVLDDAGNGFRERVADFPLCIESDKTMLVYKMSRPLGKGKLWEKVSVRQNDWVLVIHAKDIRLCDHVHVSKALSWERSAMEMVYQLKRNASLAELQKAPYLVILFGTDGALLVSHNPEEKPLLIFDPKNLEGGYAASLKGFGLSTGSAFTASLSATLLNDGIGGLGRGIKNGLSAMRNLLENGFIEKNSKVTYPFGEIFSGTEHHYSECTLEISSHLNVADPYFWRIMDEKTRLSKPLVTVDIVKNKSPKILNEIPIGKYSKLLTFDRSEIEQYNSIKNLILEFLDDPKTVRPLCIAVFGPPGSGKSFGIKQVLNSLGRNDIPTMTFNISQYAGYNDLVADFHKVRDKVLTGNIPVAFFDEFDSDEDHRAMGWLKYFLSPMQDGEFKEGEAIHPIGKSIFVFAGGTRSSFQDFEQNIGDDSSLNNQTDLEKIRIEKLERLQQFREAKGPDFVSRLRGFINILGPNPNHQGGKTDNTFMIRRAKILRTNFEITEKTSQLINSAGELQIDESLLRAMLNIPEYRHGNRSMSAILDMSRLTDKRKFDLSALPTPEQLDMHVDAKLFMWLAAGERFYSLLPVEERFELPVNCPMDWEKELIEKVAQKIHEDYYRQRITDGQSTPTLLAWSDLPDNKRKSNLDAAAEIPVKLGSIGHGIRKIKVGEPLQTPDISDEEIEKLARNEHERWCREQMIQGWRYNEIRKDSEKLHPSLVPWEKLSETEQHKDREAIYAIPRILKEAGYGVYRLEAYDAINENLIRKIAVAIHEDYCQKRKIEGQTIKTNPNLVPFEKLTNDIREANLDSAGTIPRKLKLLNIELQKAMAGTETGMLVLSPGEIEELSKWEHARWNWQKILQGWIYGPKKDEEKKTHNCILPWNQLPDNIKEYDRENVRLIPGFIKNAGYIAVRKAKK